jgi:hypothetical protein
MCDSVLTPPACPFTLLAGFDSMLKQPPGSARLGSADSPPAPFDPDTEVGCDAGKRIACSGIAH